MLLGVEKAIRRIAKDVKNKTGCDITDFLTDAVEVYEIGGDGKPAMAEDIIRNLETEAAMFEAFILTD